MELYYSSVGRNSNLLLNVPPDRRGLLHENDVKSLLAFRKLREKDTGDSGSGVRRRRGNVSRTSGRYRRARRGYPARRGPQRRRLGAARRDRKRLRLRPRPDQTGALRQSAAGRAPSPAPLPRRSARCADGYEPREPGSALATGGLPRSGRPGGPRGGPPGGGGPRLSRGHP